ncbi:flagellar assembly protein FliW [Desulfovulcanus sp.]
MAKKEIKSKLGKVLITDEQVIQFPRGLIGFEQLHEFVLLQIKDNSPFLLLQSIDDERLGLIVADPFSFLTNYQVVVGESERRILKLQDKKDLTVLVTVTIPPGEPEKTTLNLTGPILINTNSRLGLQVPQVELDGSSRVELARLGETVNRGNGETVKQGSVGAQSEL